MVYNEKSKKQIMIWGYPHEKPPYAWGTVSISVAPYVIGVLLGSMMICGTCNQLNRISCDGGSLDSYLGLWMFMNTTTGGFLRNIYIYNIYRISSMRSVINQHIHGRPLCRGLTASNLQKDLLKCVNCFTRILYLQVGKVLVDSRIPLWWIPSLSRKLQD